jgi:DNA-directed RNA polymerase specialized sigma24 family protein
VADSLVQEKKKWSLTPEAFSKLLASFDPDRERAGEKYELVRSGLVSFFEWRGAPFPEEHADETINRVARKLDEGDHISDPFTYVYGVARMLLLEIHKEREKERAALAQLPQRHPPTPGVGEKDEAELRFSCLERCLDGLSDESRDFMRQYYEGEKSVKIEGRKRLAERLGIPLNALRLRARRIRGKLEICVNECMKAGPMR